MTWSIRGNCPNCGFEKSRRSRRVHFGEQLLGMLFLPYRCDQCDERSYRLRWRLKRRYRYASERDPLWTRGRFGFPVALAIIAASLTIVALRPSKPVGAGPQQTADRAGTTATPTDIPALSAAPAIPDAEHIGGAGQRRADGAERSRRASAAHADLIKPHPRLRSRSSIVVVAADEETASRLRGSSRDLSALVRQGRVFPVSTGTGVMTLQRKGRMVRVRILEGNMAGKEGWAQSRQVATK